MFIRIKMAQQFASFLKRFIKSQGTKILLLMTLFCALGFGSLAGWAISETSNIKNSEYITDFETALPTKLVDINDELITEFASDEKREIIAFNDFRSTW